MATATINISIPDTMKAEVEEIIATEGYGKTSEFSRDSDSARRAQSNPSQPVIFVKLNGKI